MKPFVHVLAISLSLACARGQTAPARSTFLPLGPVDIIKLLPAAPRDWQMKASRANSFYNESLTSQASREFLGPPPQLSVSSASPAPAPVTRLRLTDTGKNPALFADFEEFKPGKYGNTESLYVDSIPARRITLPDGERLRMLLKGRFVIEVETHNQQPNAALVWMRQFDIPRISGTPDLPAGKLPNPVTVVSIDELNPKLNSSYQLNWSTQADLDEARNRKR